jgi:hypothetical protein
MKPALNLATLASTLSGWLNDIQVTFNEQDGYLSFDQLELEKGPRLIRPRTREYRFKRPMTIQEAFHEAVQAGIIKNNPEDRKDFFWMYKHYETLPPRTLDLECL